MKTMVESSSKFNSRRAEENVVIILIAVIITLCYRRSRALSLRFSPHPVYVLNHLVQANSRKPPTLQTNVGVYCLVIPGESHIK